MSLVAMLMPKGKSGFGYGSTAEEVVAGLDLTGKNILITGCNSGLGEESARVLAARGARIVGLARTQDKAQAAVARLPNDPIPVACELSEPASVRAAVQAVRATGVPLHAVIANAGIMALPQRQVQYGYELQFFTNHVGHFLLVTGLLDQLADRGRVVVLSSLAHTMAPRGGIRFDDLSAAQRYDRWTNYGQAKLANLLFARGLAARLAGTGKTANAVHPGVIQTNLSRHMSSIENLGFALGGPLFAKSVPQGAATQCYVAVHPGADGINGEYWADVNTKASSADGADRALAERLWTETEAIVAKLP